MNGIVSKLKAIEVNIDDEDKASRLIWPLPSSYEHMKLILMYGKETMVFSEVTSKLFSEKKRLSSGGGNISSEDSPFAVNNGKGNSKKDFFFI